MKRIVIALIIVAFIITLGFYEKSRVTNICDLLEKDINACVTLYTKNNESCVKACENTKRKWINKLPGATIYVNHEFVDEISAVLSVLPVYAKEGNNTEFYAACEYIKQLLNSIKRDQRITADSFY